MASVIKARRPNFSANLAQVISAQPAAAFRTPSAPTVTDAEIFAAANANGLNVAILDSGATHRLWHSHEAFISYTKVHN